jgi:hypothetical protein
MKESYGNTSAPIWLIGDSAPSQWIDVLSYPLDKRHPAVHNIWTPVIYEIQKQIYAKKSIIITDDENTFFIKNAVRLDNQKPPREQREWDDNKDLIEQLNGMRNDISTYEPKMVITFGAFAFEFIRRCYMTDNLNLWRKYGHWGAKKMGEEFTRSITTKDKIIPLLHTSISRRYWLQSHQGFTQDKNENYYVFVAKELHERIIDILNL